MKENTRKHSIQRSCRNIPDIWEVTQFVKQFPSHPFEIDTHSLRFASSLYQPLLAAPPHLGLDVSVVVVLEQQRCRFCVVFASSYVQGREADLAFRVMLQQQGHHRVVALLKSDGQRGKTVLVDSIGMVKKIKLN